MKIKFSRCLILTLPILFTTLVRIPAAEEGSEDEPKAADSQPMGEVKTLTNFHVDRLPANIAITPSTQPKLDIQVVGKPRNSVGHPCTLLDKEDVDGLKKILTTNKDAKSAFDTLQKDADARIAQPLGVPVAQKGPDGKWMCPFDMPGVEKHTQENNSKAMVELGMMYQLTGDEKYGEYCRKMLIAYADNYNNYGHPAGWTIQKYRSARDGRLSGQFLEDGFWLCRTAFAYDTVYNLPSWTDKDRAHIRDDLLRSVAAEFSDPVEGPENYLSAQHNRSAVCTSGVLMAGYASEDPQMINAALYGPGGSKDKPTGGLLKVHFGEGLLPDGLWIEGAPGYQIGIASCGLFNDAETLWHHGIDLYRFGGGALKRMLDSALVLAYPDAAMAEPKLHDSQGEPLLSDAGWYNNEVGVPFECGYRRYQDPSYLPIIQKATKLLTMTDHAGPISLFQDAPPADQAPPRPLVNANFYAVGYGVLRLPTADGAAQLIQEYGPSAGHAHPSKLAIDLFALGEPSIPLCGVIFPYNNPLDPAWFWTTVANCTLVVDQQSQFYSKSKGARHSRNPPMAEQLVYGPASTMGIERAWSNTVQPGITEDRALFFAPEYLADIFGGFDTAAHTYDLAWHFRGKMESSLKADPFQFPAPAAEGYNSITNLTHANTDQPWTATVTTPAGKTIRFVAPGGTPTDVYLGNGHYMTSHKDENSPAFVERHAGQNSALFGNAVDISNDPAGFVKSVAQEGSLDAGYGLLKVETVKGTDLCFTAFRPGKYTAGDLSTDAMQGFVRMDGAAVRALYLGGGTTLKTSAGGINRSEPGLAYVEKTAAGNYIVGNSSPVETTVTVTLPALSGLKSFNLDDDGKRTDAAAVSAGATAGSFKLHLKPGAKVEFGSS